MPPGSQLLGATRGMEVEWFLTQHLLMQIVLVLPLLSKYIQYQQCQFISINVMRNSDGKIINWGIKVERFLPVGALNIPHSHLFRKKNVLPFVRLDVHLLKHLQVLLIPQLHLHVLKDLQVYLLNHHQIHLVRDHLQVHLVPSHLQVHLVPNHLRVHLALHHLQVHLVPNHLQVYLVFHHLQVHLVQFLGILLLHLHHLGKLHLQIPLGLCLHKCLSRSKLVLPPSTAI
ncbi:PREDICTED: uncharacterized protein LOC101294130 [Fragaria vesca subsp. vesca]